MDMLKSIRVIVKATDCNQISLTRSFALPVFVYNIRVNGFHLFPLCDCGLKDAEQQGSKYNVFFTLNASLPPNNPVTVKKKDENRCSKSILDDVVVVDASIHLLLQALMNVDLSEEHEKKNRVKDFVAHVR
ncbi:hypothetical protein F2P81_012272 [Scophthalmus maximus]|uniref:Uncharacterized protein n=1 Tax=Scophthalmus maximus TaxID=52904 RepID=A0A6A4STZ2_SCOMX|nr:hypothetical protein F2P81_012272 [Scophthalmus maximus]